MKKVRGKWGFVIVRLENKPARIFLNGDKFMKRISIVLLVAILKIGFIEPTPVSADNCKWVTVCATGVVVNSGGWASSSKYITCGIFRGTYIIGRTKITWQAAYDYSRVEPGTPICPAPSGSGCVSLRDSPPEGGCGYADVDLSNCWNRNGAPFGYVALIRSIEKWICDGDPDPNAAITPNNDPGKPDCPQLPLN